MEAINASQVVVSLESDLHLAGSGSFCLMRAFSAAPFGNSLAISRLNSLSLASFSAKYWSSSAW